MNKYILVCTLPLVVCLVCSCGRENYVDARQIAIYAAHIQAVDSVTKQPLNVSVGIPHTKFQQHLRSGHGEKASPVLIEMNTSGLCLITWIDFSDNLAAVVLTADGYAPCTLPQDVIEKCVGSQVSGGLSLRTPKQIELSKSEQTSRSDSSTRGAGLGSPQK